MLLKNATILTMNANRDILTNGAIAVQGNRIVALGKTSALEARYPSEESLDLGGKLIIPGLIDTHVHLAQALIRGCADDMALIQWLCERVWVLQGNFTHDDGYVSARLGIAEMLRSGTTTFLESMLAHRYGFDGIAQAVQESGIRACLAGIVMDIGTYATQTNSMHPGMIESRDTSLLGVIQMHDKWQGAANDRLHVWFGPRTPGGVTSELYREMSEIAHQRQMGITMHLAEVEADKIYLQEKFGLTPVDYAESVGLLGPRSVLVHMVWLTSAEIEKLAATGTHVSHNPSSNSKLASGVCKVPLMLERGVNVALGCDGGPSNNDYDLIREMKMAAILHKAVTLDPLIVPAETVLEMATINGARALGLDHEIGSLEVGKKADLVVIDLARLHTTPAINPVSTLVYAATGGEVDTVMVDGQIVVRQGRLLTMDEHEVMREANQHANMLYQRAGIDLKPRWPIS
ncbi:amidohydrolase [Tengunoibacter tsumagoiensis]|uniref:Amidohydrolase n=1 Tax=Tengunoibacter tsumagoiensis TaxID=2014871 RepID=A0A402A1F4_9CHLR|nr:amidohydrolase [Tengunoibacter tsumagoiensis]GCE12841.1 amidohydrolase [Tengunoibacter tsumagoiensis]